MKQKQKTIIFGVIGILFLLFWLAVITLVFIFFRRPKESEQIPVVEVTLCDENASDLCVVSFGANNLNRMVINFQLPDASHVPFYVKAANRDTVSVYTCEVDEASPTSAYCTGVRTPLGETIDVEVYATDGDKLIARGTFLVSAIAISTPISLPSETTTEEEIPTPLPDSGFESTPTPLPDGGFESTPMPLPDGGFESTPMPEPGTPNL